MHNLQVYIRKGTDTIYVNDAAQENAGKAVNVVGHETPHHLLHETQGEMTTKQGRANQEEYAGMMGDATEDYLGFNFAQSDGQLAGSNNYNEPPKTHVQEVEIVKGTQVQESTVGSQTRADGTVLNGGGNQVEPLVSPEERKNAMIPIGPAKKLGDNNGD